MMVDAGRCKGLRSSLDEPVDLLRRGLKGGTWGVGDRGKMAADCWLTGAVLFGQGLGGQLSRTSRTRGRVRRGSFAGEKLGIQPKESIWRGRGITNSLGRVKGGSWGAEQTASGCLELKGRRGLPGESEFKVSVALRFGGLGDQGVGDEKKGRGVSLSVGGVGRGIGCVAAAGDWSLDKISGGSGESCLNRRLGGRGGTLLPCRLLREKSGDS